MNKESDIIIRQIDSYQFKQRKSDGYVDGNSLAKAYNKEMIDFLNLSTTKAFTQELSVHTKISEKKLIQKEMIHPQIAIHLAYWVSPKIAIIVFEWVKQWLLDSYPVVEELSEFNKALTQALNFNPKK